MGLKAAIRLQNRRQAGQEVRPVIELKPGMQPHVTRAEAYAQYWGKKPVEADEYIERLPKPPKGLSWMVQRDVMGGNTMFRPFMEVALVNGKGEIVELRRIDQGVNNNWARRLATLAGRVIEDYRSHKRR